MKHVRESLREFNDYKFFSLFEEEKDEKDEKSGTDKETLKSKEQDALAIIDKITKNFDEFKKSSGGEILRFKEFWEENQQIKKQFTEPGDIYKLSDSDYVVGVLQLPAQTLSDGSVEGGLGATDEPEEEIIEGKEIQPKQEFFEEQQVPTTPTTPAPPAVGSVTEAEEGDDLDLDLNLDDTPVEQPATETPVEEPMDTPVEEPAGSPVEDPSMEEPLDTEEPSADLTAPQVYLVVYDMASGKREEIFRCGSNNAVKSFKAFYNDIFKGSMKNAIAEYTQQKEQEKVEAEKAEKTKKETEKQSKVQKFLGENISKK